MRTVLPFAALAFVVVSCSAHEDIKPDTTGGAGGATSASSNAATTTTAAGVGGSSSSSSSSDATSSSSAATTGAGGSSSSSSTGAGGAAPQGTGYESGSRLKARYLEATDGAKQAIGWYDTQLAINCNFLPASDGKTRCMPYPNPLVVASYYQDAACTDAMVPVVAGCSAPSFVLAVDNASGCLASTTSYRAFKVNAGTVQPAQFCHVVVGMCSCSAASPGSTYYTTTEVSAASMVEAVEKVEP